MRSFDDELEFACAWGRWRIDQARNEPVLHEPAERLEPVLHAPAERLAPEPVHRACVVRHRGVRSRGRGRLRLVPVPPPVGVPR